MIRHASVHRVTALLGRRRDGRISLRGIAGLLSFFFMLCTAFCVVFALSDAVIDHQHARWPVVTATLVDRQIAETHPFTRDGGGTVYSVVARVHLPGTNDTSLAKIYSASVRETGGTPAMRQWVSSHQPNSPLRVRYTLRDPAHAELVDPEGLPQQRHVGPDLLLTVVAAVLALGTGLWARGGRSAESQPG